MNYSKNAYYMAENELIRRRNTAESEQLQRFREVSAIEPELVDVDRQIKNVNFELLKAITGKSADKNTGDLVMQIKENNRKAHQKKEQILERIGYPTNYLDTEYSCPECLDMGFIDGKMCKCFEELVQKYTFEERTENCDIKLHDFDEFMLEYYPSGSGKDDARNQMSIILNKCISYANGFGAKSGSLFMLGNTGLGKTLLCSCIAKKVIEKGYTVIFRSALNVFEDALAEHYGKRDGNTLDELDKADLLILDDLGSEFGNQSDPILYEIINSRINLCKPTIITSNLSIQQLNNRYNERIISRLFGEFELFPFVGNDIRLEKRQNN